MDDPKLPRALTDRQRRALKSALRWRAVEWSFYRLGALPVLVGFLLMVLVPRLWNSTQVGLPWLTVIVAAAFGVLMIGLVAYVALDIARSLRAGGSVVEGFVRRRLPEREKTDYFMTFEMVPNIAVKVTDAFDIDRAGATTRASGRTGMRAIGCWGRLARHLAVGDHVVLLRLGNGRAVARLSDIEAFRTDPDQDASNPDG